MGKMNGFWRKLRAFSRATGANVAMMFGLSLIPLAIAAGAGLDFANAMMVRNDMSDALDAAALALGAQNSLSSSQAQTLAQKIFNANYKGNGSPTVTPVINGQHVSVTANDSVATTLLSLVGTPYIDVSVSTLVVWGQTRLWVSLVLDNTGSMTQTDSTGTSKITALKNASHSLLTTLQSVSANAGDVQVAIVPFARDVKIGTSYVNATWIDWSDWNTQYSTAPANTVGPGSNCPWSVGCVAQPGSTSSVSTIPSSGTYKGYICPNAIGSSSTGQTGHYYDGCYNSVATQTITTTVVQTTTTTLTQNCSQKGTNPVSCGSVNSSNSNGSPQTTTVTTSGYTGDTGPTVTTSTVNGTPSSSTPSCNNKTPKTCTWTITTINTSTQTTVTGTGTNFTHAWLINDHSLWSGCIMDRGPGTIPTGDTPANDYDTNSTTPSTGTPDSLFPAENDQSCPIASVTTLNYDWTGLSNAIDAMVANGGTNQTIGLAHGMQMLTQGSPYSPPTLPNNTTRYIILLSDGLNTMDRWYGDGSNQSTSVDTRMAAACNNAKAQGFIIYTVFVDLGGTQGNSTVLQNCATDASKYYDLTTSGSIVTTFNQIAQQITNLRVAS